MASAPSAGRSSTLSTQQQVFTACIRNNVRDYGGATVCLREMLVNADDGKASEFFVCVDETSHSSEGLLSTKLIPLHGRAVYVGNNAEFTQADWQGLIQKVGRSTKARDADTAGKFGRGALTAYSYTDAAQVLSGDKFYLSDPQGTHLPDQRTAWGCSLTEHGSQDDSVIQGQLKPFMSLSGSCASAPPLVPQSRYEGTVFRLALRTTVTASQSKICNDYISDQALSQIIDNFAASLPDLMLFLRHVKSVKIYFRAADQETAVLQHQTAASIGSTFRKSSSTWLQQRLIIKTQSIDGNVSEKFWYKLVSAASHGAGVAVLTHKQGCNETTLPSVAGSVYTTMALPLEDTGLPVHINGDFWVASDRRSLWDDEGQDSKGAKNRDLLAEVIAPAWAFALHKLCREASVKQPSSIYCLWPDSMQLQPRVLEAVAAPLAACLVSSKSKVLWVPHPDLPLGLAGTWVAPHQACLLPDDLPVPAAVVAVARRAGLMVPDAPPHIHKMMRQAVVSSTGVKLLTPHTLRQSIRGKRDIVQSHEVTEVLEYVTAGADYQDLHALPLILAADGSVHTITCRRPLPGQQTASRNRFNKFYLPGRGASATIYDLMSTSLQQQVKPCGAWTKLSKWEVDDTLLMTSNCINVQWPSVADLADSLPPSWKGAVTAESHDSSTHPPPAWLIRLWDLVNTAWPQLPDELSDLMVVPLTDGRFASPTHCRRMAALSTRHLKALPAGAAGLLSAAGCLCIAQEYADSISCIPPKAVPIVAAFKALAEQPALDLSQHISPACLGNSRLQDLRQLLANHLPLSQDLSPQVWAVTKQLCIFEAADGSFTSLAEDQVVIMPSLVWEQRMVGAWHTVPWKVVRFFTGSGTQRKLLRQSSLLPLALPTFLDQHLLAHLQTSADTAAQQLLLQALHDLAGFPGFVPTRPDHLLVNGQAVPIAKLVHGDSVLLGGLFANSPSGHAILPTRFQSVECIPVLQKRQLLCEDQPDPAFFLVCAAHLQALAAQGLPLPTTKNLSDYLVGKLKQHMSAYREFTSAPERQRWTECQQQLADCQVFLAAALPSPYTQRPFQLVSLTGSEEHSNYRLVASAVPITDCAQDTKQLRTDLGLALKPQLQHVVAHLLLTAQPAAGQPSLPHTLHATGQAAILKLVEEDIEKGYECIMTGVAELLADQPAAQPGLAAITDQLRSQPWVMIPGYIFVTPAQLEFVQAEDKHAGVRVPEALAKHLADRPAVRQWMVQQLGVCDLETGVPVVKSLYKNPTIPARRRCTASLDNWRTLPNAIVLLQGREVLVHKAIIGRACPALAASWKPGYSCQAQLPHLPAAPQDAPTAPVSTDPASSTLSDNEAGRQRRLDLFRRHAVTVACSCIECDIPSTDYATGFMLLHFMYTGKLTWPGGGADADTACQMLVFADMYDVPFLLEEAQIALRNQVDVQSCCGILRMAWHHNACQLEEFCLQFITGAHADSISADQLGLLDDALREKLSQRGWAG